MLVVLRIKVILVVASVRIGARVWGSTVRVSE